MRSIWYLDFKPRLHSSWGWIVPRLHVKITFFISVNPTWLSCQEYVLHQHGNYLILMPSLLSSSASRLPVSHAKNTYLIRTLATLLSWQDYALHENLSYLTLKSRLPPSLGHEYFLLQHGNYLAFMSRLPSWRLPASLRTASAPELPDFDAQPTPFIRGGGYLGFKPRLLAWSGWQLTFSSRQGYFLDHHHNLPDHHAKTTVLISNPPYLAFKPLVPTWSAPKPT